MQAFSIIDIPESQKKKIRKNFLGVGIDYKRFNIKDRSILDQLMLSSKKASDTDNSDIIYEGEVAFMRVNSPRGVAHNITLAIVGGKPINFAYIEIYGFGQGLRGSVARIDFKGSFFHFKDIIPKRWINVYDNLQKLADEGNKVRITRIDVAIDSAIPFPQTGEGWLKPSKLAKREIECYRHDNKWNSFAYLAEKNTSYGVRIYNKNLDIVKKEKEFWYGGKEKLPEDWTRIEFEFYPPYTIDIPEKKLIEDCVMRCTDGKMINLGLTFRPCLEFKIERAYDYFCRYAKNHGISIEELIDSIVDYHCKIEELNYLGHDKEI